jgi:dephospho-CoA kinase
MLLVGLTGGIGSGKSTVAQMLAGHGAALLDSDRFARDAVEPGTPGFDRVVSAFGPEIVGPDGSLDRARLARIVFHDESRRRALEGIVHPEVRRMIAEGIARYAGTDRVVVVDSPLLIETGSHGMFDVVIVVSADPKTQIRRLVDRGMDEADARARLAAQMPMEEKAKAADILLDNEGSIEDLTREVDALWKTLSARSAGRA